MLSMKKYGLLVAVLGVCASFLLGSSAHALSLAPTYYEINAKPGEVVTKAVRVTNDSDEPIVITHDTTNFVAGAGEKGYPQFTGKQTDVSTLANWITVNVPKITIPPRQKVDVPFTVVVPLDAEPGGHYAALTWGTSSPSAKGSGSVDITGQIATLILLNVAGTTSESGQIISFETASRATNYQKLPVQFVTKIANTGNVHFKPVGQVTIKNMFGRTVATLPFNVVKDGGNILPKSVRVFETTWDKQFAFGKYTATLDASYGKAGTISGEYTFWVVDPLLAIMWAVIAIILVVILILLGTLASRSRNGKADGTVKKGKK